jgi:hypothetical protein
VDVFVSLVLLIAPFLVVGALVTLLVVVIGSATRPRG